MSRCEMEFDMRKTAYLTIVALSVGCGGVVDHDFGSGDASGGTSGAGSTGPGSPAEHGMPCKYRHGTASMTAYDGNNYASSAYSFEYASQDPAVTHNEFDVLYEGNWFRVNTVTDDQSEIVDLGPIELADVPGSVDVALYPVGTQGGHDYVEAHVGHTYWVHSVDGAGELVSAFRVLGLEPGFQVGIEWIRSASPSEMAVPVECGL